MNFKLNLFFEKWITWVQAKAWWVLGFYCLVFAGGIYLSATKLGLNTDLSDMISERLDFHKRWKDYLREFPHLTDTLLVVIDSDSSHKSSEFAEALIQKLDKEPQHFKHRFRLNGGDFFERYGILYQSEAELKSLKSLEQVSQALASNPGLPVLFGVLGQTPVNSQSLPLWESLSESFESFEAASAKPFNILASAQEETRQFVEIYPALDYEELLPAEESILALRSILSELETSDVNVRVTGVAALGFEELQSVSAGAALAGLLSLIFVGLILFVCLRSWPLIFICLATLILGLVMTAGFAALSIGHLNLISVAFAVLFIGLGIDYSIHLSLRYRQLAERESSSRALMLSMKEIGGSLVICTLTTSAGFFAFVPTAYAGVSELGIISGAGMIINLLIHISFFPALLQVLAPRFSSTVAVKDSVGAFISRFSYEHARWVRLSALVLALVSLPWALQVSFDPNPLNLQDPTTEAYQTYRSLLNEAERAPWTIKILEDSAEDAFEATKVLEALPEVGQVVWAGSFVPEAQSEKLEFLRSLRWPEKISIGDASSRGGLAALDSLERSIRSSEPSEEEALQMKSRLLAAMDSFREDSKSDKSAKELWMRENILKPTASGLENFPKRWPRSPIELEQLPSEVRNRYISDSGRYRIEVFSKENIQDIDAMRDFADAVLAVNAKATDDPVTLPLSGDAVVEAFLQASILAFLLIFALVWAMTRSLRDSVLVMIPIFFAAFVVKAGMTLVGASFNFANIIVLPLLLGIGVDSGVHLLHRFRNSSLEEAFQGTTSRAVFFSSITTIASFGTLSISSHRGTASMGILLMLGTLVVMISTLMLIPALVRKKKVS